ncbi:ATP-binding protein [Microbacterium sp. cx-59]|uniref:ATP-binding protein n=1 Tax=Microbacterium sp. cx-59 TaxID=2891207 RepID=UPI001E2F9E82|nr:ATP-binding protein [Microbacterium sp. cx-59]MCC4908812.1 ATP-binding protein [Microbacterium sp. cx-59]
MASEHISRDEALEGIEAAEKAIGALSADLYARIVMEHGAEAAPVAKAILAGVPLASDAVTYIAGTVLENALAGLLSMPAFKAQVDEAIRLETGRLILAQQRQADESVRDADVAARLRSQFLNESFRRHSTTRVTAIESPHVGRDLHGAIASQLGKQVVRVEAWRDDVGRERQLLSRALVEANRRSRTAGPIDRIDLRGSYDAAHGQLRNAAVFLRPESDHDNLPRNARAALARLKREINEPRFRTAVLLTGRWGAGKSRAIAEIASKVLNDRGPQLILRPLPGAGRHLDAAVLEEAEVAAGRRYGSMSEFRAELKDLDARAVIFVDDVDQFLPTQAEVDRLTQMMLDQTSDDRLRWVFTVDSWRLDRVLSKESTPRWDRLSAFSRETPTVSAWTDLDSAEVIGSALIRRELGSMPHAGQTMLELLEVPLNAWLYVDATRVAAEDGTVVGFDQAYWNEALDNLTSTEGERRDCEAVRRALDQLFTESFGQPLRLDDLYQRAAPLSRDDVDDSVDVFGDARLLDWSPDGTITMASAPLWASGIAFQLLPPALSGSAKSAGRVVLSAMTDFAPELAEAIVAKVLVQASNSPEELSLILRSVLRAPQRAESGIWVAALDNAAVRMAVLAQLEGQTPPSDGARRGAHDTYLLLRLIERDESTLSFLSALRWIKPSYSTIGESGLQTVLEPVIRRLAPDDVQTERQRQELLSIADGISRARAGATFADQWVAVASGHVRSDLLLTEVERFIRETANYSKAEFEAPAVRDFGRPDDAPLALHLVDAILPRFIREQGVGFAYDVLVGRGWLDEDDWRDGIGGEIRRQSHVELGKSYSQDPQAVMALLDRLVRGDRTEQESAVFVLRHTGPTYGRRGVRLNEELKPYAARLDLSKRLERDFKTRWVKPLLTTAAE